MSNPVTAVFPLASNLNGTGQSGALSLTGAGDVAYSGGLWLQEGTVNLLTNPSFEVGTWWVSWGGPTTNARSSEQHLDGSYSQKIVTNAVGDGIASPNSDRVAVAASTVYTMAAITPALGQYEPLANVATTVRSRAYNWEAEIKAKLVDDEWSTVESKRAELEAMDAARGTLCYRDDRSRKHFCTMPRCDIEDQLPGWYETRQQFREEKYTEGMS